MSAYAQETLALSEQVVAAAPVSEKAEDGKWVPGSAGLGGLIGAYDSGLLRLAPRIGAAMKTRYLAGGLAAQLPAYYQDEWEEGLNKLYGQAPVEATQPASVSLRAEPKPPPHLVDHSVFGLGSPRSWC